LPEAQPRMVAPARWVYTVCTNGEPLIPGSQSADGMKRQAPRSTWPHRLPNRENTL